MKLLEDFPVLGRVFSPEKQISRIVSSFVTENNLDNEIALGIAGALRSRDLTRAVELAGQVPLQLYGTYAEHLQMNQLSLMVRKIPWKIPGLDPELNAMKKFYASEHRDSRLNQRFRAERRVGREPYASYRAHARAWISRVLGTTPRLEEIYALSDYPSGAVVGVGGSNTSVFRKLESSISATPTALPHFIDAAWQHAQLQAQYCPSKNGVVCLDKTAFAANIRSRVELVEYNEIFMVPKDSDCHRVAAKEPLANSFIQKGVDLWMKRRLRRFGLDLTLQEPNQRLAYAGSVEEINPFATIDLSSASDSMSIGLVRDLLPPDWFDFLNQIRSPAYLYSGRVVRNHKFCSMGNGFCFPLETLLFASLIHAAYQVTGDTLFRVYGDDIIVRQSSALLVIELLRWAGFQTNKKKTFVFGPFRESCGADWYRGVNVRPYTIDFLPSQAIDLCRIHNGLLYNPNVARQTEALRSLIRLDLEGYPTAPEELVNCGDYAHQALIVPMDVFMGSKHAKWVRSEQRWGWSEFELKGVSIDTSKYSNTTLMYGLLRGARPSEFHARVQTGKGTAWLKYDHLPGATLRRKTRLGVTSH